MANKEGVAEEYDVAAVAVDVAAVMLMLLLWVGACAWLMAPSIKDLDGLSLVD